MPKMHNLRDLFLMELKDIYSAENQILKALPKMAKAAASPQVQSAFQEHIEQTRGQVERLNEIFQQLGTQGRGHKCEGMEGLLKEGEEMMDQSAEPQVKDAALIACAQKAEHYEISGYGTCRAYAQTLGEDQIANILEQTLNEEKMTDKRLTRLAEQTINPKAAGRSYSSGPSGESGKESDDFPKENAEDLNI